jgi:hypothetical protein
MSDRFVNFDTGMPQTIGLDSQTFTGGASGPGIQISPLAGSLNQGLVISQSPSASASATTFYNQVQVNDTATITGGGSYGVGLLVNENFGGSSVQGGRIAGYFQAQLAAATNASNANRNYIGITGQGIALSADTGTSPNAPGTAAGMMFGGGFIGGLFSPATSFLVVTGTEFNSFIATGASAWAKTLAQFSADLRDRVQGTVVDTMLWFYNQSASNPGWNNGLLFDGGNQPWPIASGGTIIKTLGSATVAHGIDFSATTFSSDAFKSSGFSVDGSGNVSPHLISVAVPTNANAATAGVAVGQLYRDTADPAKVYVRTV